MKFDKSGANISIIDNGFLGLLTILFIGLKLTDYIDWSWWWALSPILIPLTLVVLVGVIIIIKED